MKNKSLFALWMLVSIIVACATSLTGCKAWRTITTTASYSVTNDSTRTATTITSKTVEEYQGAKKK